jgi:hypothetical protein
MATYHVAKNGNDGSSGSQAYPFLTVPRAAGIVLPGDTVIIHEGRYNEYIEINRSGTPASWINFRGAPGEQVIIDGAGINPAWPALSHLWINGASYIALEDMESVNSFSMGVACRNECHFLVFRHLYLHECIDSGIYLMYEFYNTNPELCTDMLIDGCITERTNTSSIPNQEGMSLVGVNRFEVRYHKMLTQAGQAGLTCKEATSNGHIHHCLFNQHNTNGLYLDAGYNMSGHTRNIEVDHNIFKRNSVGCDMQAESANTQNLELHYLENINFHHNLIYEMFTDPIPPASLGTFWAGMGLGHNAHSVGAPPHKNIQVHENIIVAYHAQYTSGIGIGALADAWENCGIKNNTFINYAGYESFLSHAYWPNWGPGLVVDGNRYYTPGGTYIERHTPDWDMDGGNMFGTNRAVGLDAVLDNSKGILEAGIAKTATVQVQVQPANIISSIELWLGPDENTKIATSGKVSFISTGNMQSVNIPITMPNYGVYYVYLDLYTLDTLIASFIGEDMVIVVA